jgi:hypothetical protein
MSTALDRFVSDRIGRRSLQFSRFQPNASWRRRTGVNSRNPMRRLVHAVLLDRLTFAAGENTDDHHQTQ